MNEVINNLPEIVKDSGLKQKFIAQKIGIKESTMSALMRGQLPELPNALKIAKFFGKSVEEIWSLKQEEPASE